jgi:hypothetical protein
MSTKLNRFTPLTGLVFAVLALIAFATASGAPSAGDSGAKVIAFYKAHSSNAQTSDLLWTVAFVFLVFFAASICTMARRAPESDGLRWVVAAGAAVLAAGAAVYFGFDFTLASGAGDLSPAGAQALNLLALKLYLPVGAGGVIFGVGAGLTIARGSLLPTWVGWVGVAVGVLAVAGVVGLLPLILWTALTSVLIFRRTGRLPSAADGVEANAVPA